jgi:hypothetical protein
MQILHKNIFNGQTRYFSTLSRDEMKCSLMFLCTLNNAVLWSWECMSINCKYDRDLGIPKQWHLYVGEYFQVYNTASKKDVAESSETSITTQKSTLCHNLAGLKINRYTFILFFIARYTLHSY